MTVTPSFIKQPSKNYHCVGSGRYQIFIARLSRDTYTAYPRSYCYSDYKKISFKEWETTGLIKWITHEGGRKDLEVQIKYADTDITGWRAKRFLFWKYEEPEYGQVERFAWIPEDKFHTKYQPKVEVVSCAC